MRPFRNGEETWYLATREFAREAQAEKACEALAQLSANGNRLTVIQHSQIITPRLVSVFSPDPEMVERALKLIGGKRREPDTEWASKLMDYMRGRS